MQISSIKTDAGTSRLLRCLSSVIARLPFTARIGLALILIGAISFGSWACWEATRIWVPLNVPISLSRGHIRTPEFKINVESTYEIRIGVSRRFDFWGVPCLIGVSLCDGNPAALQMAWSLSHGGRILANGTSNGDQGAIGGTDAMRRILGDFQAGKGIYVLDLDILQDGSRLNSASPRLVVFEAGFEWYHADAMGRDILFLSLLLAVAGTCLIIRSARSRRREELAALARSCSLTQPEPQPRDLRMDREPLASPVVQTGSRPPASACVGAVLILAGLTTYASIQRWIDTRILVALDTPISLAPGHHRTGPFRINLGEYYAIDVATGGNRSYIASCKTRWLLYRGGQVADGSDQSFSVDGDVFLGGFVGERGVYDLDIEVLKDAGCFNSARPRLRVVTLARSYAGFTSLSLWLCTICMGAGGALLAIGGVERFRKPSPPVAPCVHKGTAGADLRWKRRPLRAQPFSRTSYFGLIATITYLMVLLPAWLLQSWTRPVPSRKA